MCDDNNSSNIHNDSNSLDATSTQYLLKSRLSSRAQDASKGGAVETGCSGLHYIIGCFIIWY